MVRLPPLPGEEDEGEVDVMPVVVVVSSPVVADAPLVVVSSVVDVVGWLIEVVGCGVVGGRVVGAALVGTVGVVVATVAWVVGAGGGLVLAPAVVTVAAAVVEVVGASVDEVVDGSVLGVVADASVVVGASAVDRAAAVDEAFGATVTSGPVDPRAVLGDGAAETPPAVSGAAEPDSAAGARSEALSNVAPSVEAPDCSLNPAWMALSLGSPDITSTPVMIAAAPTRTTSEPCATRRASLDWPSFERSAGACRCCTVGS